MYLTFLGHPGVINLNKDRHKHIVIAVSQSWKKMVKKLPVCYINRPFLANYALNLKGKSISKAAQYGAGQIPDDPSPHPPLRGRPHRHPLPGDLSFSYSYFLPHQIRLDVK